MVPVNSIMILGGDESRIFFVSFSLLIERELRVGRKDHASKSSGFPFVVNVFQLLNKLLAAVQCQTCYAMLRLSASYGL